MNTRLIVDRYLNGLIFEGPLFLAVILFYSYLCITNICAIQIPICITLLKQIVLEAFLYVFDGDCGFQTAGLFLIIGGKSEQELYQDLLVV